MSGQIAFWKQLVLTIVVIGLGFGAWVNQDILLATAGISQETTKKRGKKTKRGQPVIVAPVRFTLDQLTLKAVGTGRAQRTVMLRSASAGKIVETKLAAGRPFKAGDPLLKIDDAEQKVVVALAEARLEQAQSVLKRFEKLGRSGTVTQARLDEARTTERIAHLELERERVILKDKVLHAPFDGVSGLANMEIGAWIDTDAEIASFDDRTTILVEFDLPETMMTRVKLGSEIKATTPALPGRVFKGGIRAIDSRLIAESRTTRVRVAIANEDDNLRPGSSFTIELTLTGNIYPVVPELSVQFARGALFVWRVTDSKAERVNVTMVRRRDGMVLVDGPLSKEDVVIVEGTQRMTEGKKLEVKGTTAGDPS